MSIEAALTLATTRQEDTEETGGNDSLDCYTPPLDRDSWPEGEQEDLVLEIVHSSNPDRESIQIVPSFSQEIRKDGKIISNLCPEGLDIVMRLIEQANRDSNKEFLRNAPLIVAMRDHDALEEIAQQITAVLCPDNTLTQIEHHMPHYVLRDGKINRYHNQDLLSAIADVFIRLKHPCSLDEKLERTSAKYRRISDPYDPNRLLLNDIYGVEIDVVEEEHIPLVIEMLRSMPFLHFDDKNIDHKNKKNGYRATNIDSIYLNPKNPFAHRQCVEMQIKTVRQHRESKEDNLQAHDTTYARIKLAEDRRLFGYDVVIFGNHVLAPPNVPSVRTEGFRIASVKGPFQNYTAVIPNDN